MRRRFWSGHEPSQVLGAVALLLLAACGNEPVQGRPALSDVTEAYGALSSEVATCAQGVAVCIQGAGQDFATMQACHGELEGCAEVGQGAVDDLANAAGACADHGSACFDAAAGDRVALQACGQELANCFGVDAPVPSMEPDVGEDDSGEDGCVDGLARCALAGGNISGCVQDVRACVLGALPWPEDVAAIAAAAGQAAMDGDMEGPDEDDDIEEAGEPPAMGEPWAQPGAGEAAGEADAQPEPDAMEMAPQGDPWAAIACLELLGVCLADGSDPIACLDEVRVCKAAIDE